MNDQKGIPTFERLEDLFRSRGVQRFFLKELAENCLLYTSDAADE